jgi:hypothetical protein
MALLFGYLRRARRVRSIGQPRHVTKATSSQKKSFYKEWDGWRRLTYPLSQRASAFFGRLVEKVGVVSIPAKA